jgi:hypothetical protein
VTFVVPHDTGLDIFFEGLSKRSYYSLSVAYQVDYVQGYPGYPPKSERPYRRFSGVYDDGFPTHRTYGFEERACQPSIRPERGRLWAPLVEQAKVLLYETRGSRTLDIASKSWVAFDAVWIGAFYSLASYAGPERASLIRSVDIEDVQAFTAGADRNTQFLRVDPTKQLAADPAVQDYIRYFPTLSTSGWFPSTISRMVEPLSAPNITAERSASR